VGRVFNSKLGRIGIQHGKRISYIEFASNIYLWPICGVGYLTGENL
jgi:hypothetical protein